MDIPARDKLPYRQGALGIIINDQKQILLITKPTYKTKEWNFPGGGIDQNETPEQAIIRELNEELGSNNFQIIAKSSHPHQYEWPYEVVRRRFQEKGETYRGQQQTIFLIKFLGQSTDIRIDTKEISQYKWVSKDQLWEHLIFPNLKEQTAKYLVEFNNFLNF